MDDYAGKWHLAICSSSSLSTLDFVATAHKSNLGGPRFTQATAVNPALIRLSVSVRLVNPNLCAINVFPEAIDGR